MNQVGLGDSVWLHFGTSSPTTGAAANADSTPTVTVAEDGTDIAYSPTVTNVATGLYKVQIDATAPNGFEAGKRYSVYVAATVASITGRDGIGEFEVLATDLNTGVASVQGNVTGSVASVTAAVTVGANNDKTGYTLVSGPLDAAGTRSALGLAAANLDTQIGTLMTSASYTAPDNASITSIKAKTDSLGFTVAGKVDSNLLYVNGTAVSGSGTSGSPWGPA
jgi:hypothetical protein